VIHLLRPQQRLWLLINLNEQPAYNIPAAVRSLGWLNVVALEQSLSEIIRPPRSVADTFRRFKRGDYSDHFSCFLNGDSRDDLRQRPETTPLALATSLITLEVRRPFDLSQGPMLPARFLRLSSDDSYRCICDASYCGRWLVHGFVNRRDSLAVYSFSLAEVFQRLVELPIQYADYADRQK